MRDRRRKNCDVCGAVADFALVWPPKETPEAPVRLIWQCRQCEVTLPVVASLPE